MSYTTDELAVLFYEKYNELKSNGASYKDRCVYAEIAVEKYIEQMKEEWY